MPAEALSTVAAAAPADRPTAPSGPAPAGNLLTRHCLAADFRPTAPRNAAVAETAQQKQGDKNGDLRSRRLYVTLGQLPLSREGEGMSSRIARPTPGRLGVDRLTPGKR